MSWPDVTVSTGENIPLRFTVRDGGDSLVDFTGLAPRLAIIEGGSVKTPPGVIAGSSPALGELEFIVDVPGAEFSAVYEVAVFDAYSNKNVLTDRENPKFIARKSYIT